MHENAIRTLSVRRYDNRRLIIRLAGRQFECAKERRKGLPFRTDIILAGKKATRKEGALEGS